MLGLRPGPEEDQGDPPEHPVGGSGHADRDLRVQDGHFEDLLNFESTGAITAWFPLIVFGVFILRRIKEAVDRGQSTSERSATASSPRPAW
jgi:hypothetical protein